jgi:hypothetical protein
MEFVFGGQSELIWDDQDKLPTFFEQFQAKVLNLYNNHFN